MTTPLPEQAHLPAWLAEGLEGEPTGELLNRRSEPRHVFSGIARVRPEHDPSATPVSVRPFNVSPRGIGFIARQEFEEAQRLIIFPEGTSEPDANQAAVRLRVVHCTQTIQGYKVGCVIEPA